MTIAFDDSVRNLLDGKNFATLATVNPDGSPQTSVVWVGRRGDTVVFSTREGLRKTRNMRRDPRVSLTLTDHADPYRAVNIEGRVEITEDPERALPAELSQKYLGVPPPPEAEDVVRLIVAIVPHRVTGRALR